VAEFSASDAAFSGFRIVWQRPWIVGVWAALQFAMSLAVNLFVAYSAGAAFTKLAQFGPLPQAQDTTAVFELFRQAAPTYAVLLISVLVMNSVTYAAMNRAVFHPEQSSFGYLRLAADELRQLGLLVLYAMLAFAIYLGLAVIMAVLVLMLGIASLGALIVLVLIPMILCAIVFVGLRFSLASPLTYATHRVDLFGSWGLTRGRFLPLLLTYLIAYALSFLVFLLIFAIAAILAVVAGGSTAAFMSPNLNSLAAAVTPPRLIYLAITSFGQALIWPITITPPAIIYRAITGLGGAIGRVFD
jgi:hypothetical protein